eukprot:TRINITY_DN71637_c0_g1_i1.p1 TRINITY_DN71637_c0_g1~~TRINITY_DN71637_c0_g1_i1.p1  ORF type:complete len:612 (-),score=71.17 TRINITY_DN71637_c0_g1_i1:59-1894(-)
MNHGRARQHSRRGNAPRQRRAGGGSSHRRGGADADRRPAWDDDTRASGLFAAAPRLREAQEDVIAQSARQTSTSAPRPPMMMRPNTARSATRSHVGATGLSEVLDVGGQTEASQARPQRQRPGSGGALRRRFPGYQPKASSAMVAPASPTSVAGFSDRRLDSSRLSVPSSRRSASPMAASMNVSPVAASSMAAFFHTTSLHSLGSASEDAPAATVSELESVESARSYLEDEPFPLLDLQVPPGPAMLDVLHVQSCPANAADAHELAIVLPDGTPLGSRGFTVHETLPVAEQRCANVHDISAAPDAFPHLKAPLLPEERMRSLSERLSALLGPTESPPVQYEVTRTVHQSGNRESAASLLCRNRSTVVRQVQELTDLVLQEILGDTVSLLNAMPDTSSTVACETFQPHDLVQRASPRHIQQSSSQTLPPGRRPLLHSDIAFPVEEAASVELGQLELELRRKYLSPKTTSSPRDMSCLESRGAYGLKPSVEGGRFHVGHAREQHFNFSRELEGMVEQHPSPLRRFASVEPEALRRIERYRQRFAQHCLASREAGVEVGGPGSDAFATATWIVWPYIADSIVAGVVEEAIDEVHEAMEAHIDDMIREEVGDEPP